MSTIDKDIEACAVQLASACNNVCILTIHRFPVGKFTDFLERLDLILQKFYNGKYNICADVNVNYVTDNNRKSKLYAVLHYYNLLI
jgi:hypothetical protein